MEAELVGEDWENACHELLWEKGREGLFMEIQQRAFELMADRRREDSRQLTERMKNERG